MRKDQKMKIISILVLTFSYAVFGGGLFYSESAYFDYSILMSLVSGIMFSLSFVSLLFFEKTYKYNLNSFFVCACSLVPFWLFFSLLNGFDHHNAYGFLITALLAWCIGIGVLKTLYGPR